MRYRLEVSSRALPGRAEEYDLWYRTIHAGEVLALPGFLGVERFRRLDADGSDGEFVAHYAVETDDPQALLQSLFAATPTMRLTDAIDPQSPRFTFLRPLPQGPFSERQPHE